MSYDFVIWGQPNCQYCDMAKKLVESKGMSYIYKEIGSGYTKQDLLAAIPTARSVPQIFSADGVYIGGYNNLKQELDD